MPNIRTLKHYFLLSLLSLALSLPGAFAKPADPSADILNVKPLAPTARLTSLDQTIATLLAQHHYRQSKLDDRLSSLILTTYLDDLDFSRSYFLAGDIAGFEKYRNTLDDALKSANLQPAYDIYNTYLRRLAERMGQPPAAPAPRTPSAGESASRIPRAGRRGGPFG